MGVCGRGDQGGNSPRASQATVRIFIFTLNKIETIKNISVTWSDL